MSNLTVNLLSNIVLLSLLAWGALLLYRNRRAKFGLVIKENGRVLCDGKQGIESTIGRATSCDAVIRDDPSISRKQAVVRYDDKTASIKASTRFQPMSLAEVIPNHLLEYSLAEPTAHIYESSEILTILAIGFVLLRMVTVYGEVRKATALIPFAVIAAYLLSAAIIRADHTPIVETVFAILLTYYVDATLYYGADTAAIRDTVLGVGLYCACALGIYVFLLFDISKIHTLLRIIACGMTVALIALNLALAKNINGAYNWISIGRLSFQPSEAIKPLLAFVLIAPTRQTTSNAKNFLFMFAMPALCFGYALLIKDVGALLMFGVLFLTAVFIQSDNLLFSFTLIIAAVLGCRIILLISETASSRFAGWRGSSTSVFSLFTGSGVFENAYDYGYQSVHALTAAFRNGGLLGNGSFDVLRGVTAANSDLIMGLLTQKHGTIWLALLLPFYLLLIAAVALNMRQKTKLQQTFTVLSLTLILFAMLLNTGGTFGIIALTGVVNPALSDGMSAAISYGTLFGVLASSGLSKKYITNFKEDKLNENQNLRSA